MTREEAIKKLDDLPEDGDNEISHGDADDILIERLKAVGETEVAKAWERAANRVGFWYA